MDGVLGLGSKGSSLNGWMGMGEETEGMNRMGERSTKVDKDMEK